MPKLNQPEDSPRSRSLRKPMRTCSRTSVTLSRLEFRYSLSSMEVHSTLTTREWSLSSMILLVDRNYNSSLPRDVLLFHLLSLTVTSPTSFKRLTKWTKGQMQANELVITTTDRIAFLAMNCSSTNSIVVLTISYVNLTGFNSLIMITTFFILNISTILLMSTLICVENLYIQDFLALLIDDY